MINFEQFMDQSQRFNDDGTAMTKEQLAEAIKNLPAESEPESRAVRFSTVNRQIVKDSDKCNLCVANDDPNNVPVHPNCHCNVITDEVETGVVDPGHRLLDVLSRATENLEIEGVDLLEGQSIQLLPETVATFGEEIRFADTARWLEQMQPYLENANHYITIVVDEDADEAAAEIEQLMEVLAQDAEAALNILQTKKFWLSIAKAVI